MIRKGIAVLNRRQLLSGAGAALGLGVLSTRSVAAGDAKPGLRAAHITDPHIFDDRDAPAGVAAMFAHLSGQKQPVDLVLNTGDTVYAVNGEKVTGAQALRQIELWLAAAKGSPAPIKSCLGNHDIWGGTAPTDAAPASKAGPGLVSDALDIPAPWYAFDAGGWRFVVLSSAWPHNGTLGDEQFAWLAEELAAVPAEMPICVLSHYPILSVTSLVYGDETRKGNNNVVPGTWQHADCWAITELFRHHAGVDGKGGVKLCLSGHMHTRDRCEYRGVWYVCGGAVSGSWWEGSEYGFPPSYSLIDFYSDGTFEYSFVDYGWPARDWVGKELEPPTS